MNVHGKSGHIAGEIIRYDLTTDRYIIPDFPIIPFIEGDGIGPDIWAASVEVFDAAVKHVYGDKKAVIWKEVLAGEKANKIKGEYLPEETLDTLRKHHIAIKGPLTTPVGGGFRSLNVTLRQIFDLYACIRPVTYFEGVPSPVKEPEKVNLVIFRENTEDVYAGIEWRAEDEASLKLRNYLKENMDVDIREGSGIGIKPVSSFGSKRLVRKAIRYAEEEGMPSVTLVHKGNIMKYTEGAFRDWGYELAKEEFGDATLSEDEMWEKFEGKQPDGKILVKDRIADAMFQQILLRPDEYSVVATMNLNGDYLSDAAVAQVGGLGLAPGANVGDGMAIFEATHGTAPKYAGQDKVNPSSVILSGCMMFKFLGWREVADTITNAISQTIKNKTVTYDLERQMEGAKLLKCSEFGQAIIDNMA